MNLTIKDVKNDEGKRAKLEKRSGEVKKCPSRSRNSKKISRTKPLQSISKDKLKKIINNRENFKISKNLADCLVFNRSSSSRRPIFEQSDSIVRGDRSKVQKSVEIPKLMAFLPGKMKLKERFMIGMSVSFVLLTIFLILDLQMDMGLTGHHLVPSHGRVKFANSEDGPGAAYNAFRRKFLQKGNGSKESGGVVVHGASGTSQQTELIEENKIDNSADLHTGKKAKEQVHDDFKELLDFVIVRSGQNKDSGDGIGAFEFTSGNVKEYNPSLQQLLGIRSR